MAAGRRGLLRGLRQRSPVLPLGRQRPGHPVRREAGRGLQRDVLRALEDLVVVLQSCVEEHPYGVVLFASVLQLVYGEQHGVGEDASLADVPRRLAVEAAGDRYGFTALPHILVEVADGSRVAAVRQDHDARALVDVACKCRCQVVVDKKSLGRDLSLGAHQTQRFVLAVLLISVGVVHLSAMARVVEHEVVVWATATANFFDGRQHVLLRALLIVHGDYVLDSALPGQRLHILAVDRARERILRLLVVQSHNEHVDFPALLDLRGSSSVVLL
mmetsp:Transcript_85422/g.226836  ORF Transcript_85422/g.226836 Transcript_85422/m.226836 type:complete len:273 (+) Transcript_85422:557-1375(+)